MRYRVHLPEDGPIEARDIFGLGRITREPVELELKPDQVKSLRARGIVLEPVDKAPSKKSAREE